MSCSDELSALVAGFHHFKRRFARGSSNFSVQIANCIHNLYVASLFSGTSHLWKHLPASHDCQLRSPKI